MKTRSAAETAAFLVQARARKKLADEADDKQLTRELEDLRFLVEQWPDDLKTQRAGQNAAAGLPPIPARPCLSIDTLRDPIAHVAAEAQQTDLGPELTPADDFGALVGPIDDTEIELREGLVRKIQRESAARDARNWAADRARKAGRGYYIVLTRYVSDQSRDQEIYVDGIYNQSTVRIDPSHEKDDGSDAEWEFWGTDLSWDTYKVEFPDRASKAKAEGDDDAEWRGLGDQAPDWFHGEKSGDKDTRFVRVMNYCYLEREKVTGDGPDAREYTKKTVKWAKIDGANILEETELPGPFMPIVKVIWESIQPYDNERRVQGMVRPARDAAFGVSVMATTEVEVALNAPRQPVIAYAGQFEGYEEAWNQWATRPGIQRLEVNATTDQVTGQVLPKPERLAFDGAVAQWDGLRQMFVNAVKSSTGIPDATLGNVDPSVRSGRAIRQLIEQSRQGTSGGLANLVKSCTQEAKIINGWLYPIYGTRPGRLLRMMTGKHESQSVLVGSKDQPQPFVRDAKQRPVPFDAQQHQGQQPELFHLTPDATFNVAIRVSKDYDTRRQEESSMIGDLIQAEPQLITWFGDLWLENQDGPGHKDMAERAKLMLAPPIQAKLAGKDGGLPPQAQAAIQQLQQQLQQLQQEHAADTIKVQGQLQQAQIKSQADMQIAQMQAQADLQREHLISARAIAVARIGAAKSAMDIQAESAEERLATGIELAHEAQQSAIDRAHEVGMAAMGQQHAQDNAQMSAVQAQQAQAADQSHQQQMAAQQAAQRAQVPNA